MIITMTRCLVGAPGPPALVLPGGRQWGNRAGPGQWRPLPARHGWNNSVYACSGAGSFSRAIAPM
jgi:hypothetical protein